MICIRVPWVLLLPLACVTCDKAADDVETKGLRESVDTSSVLSSAPEAPESAIARRTRLFFRDVVRQAYSLESQLYESPDEFNSWEDVYRHYRRGFSEEIARRLADYSWWAEGNYLNEGDPVLAVPHDIVMLESSADHAMVAYPSTDLMVEVWGSKEYTIDRLRRENDHWVIVGSVTTDTMPSRENMLPN